MHIIGLYSCDMTSASLEAFKYNSYSQYGEDGLVREILLRISKSTNLDKWCCEFGAWDGLHYSNTARLILEDGYAAVLIEGDSSRVKAMEHNFPQSEVHKICSFVSPTGNNSLDRILATTEIPVDFDFLSIDIDGMDYWILESLKIYQPKMICIEFNPSIPNVVSYVQEKNSKVKHGSSARAIMNLAVRKGYRLVAATQCNLLLVRQDLADSVSSSAPDLEVLVPLGNDPQYIFCGYDGTILSNKEHIILAWHNVYPTDNLQILPKFLRSYSGDYNFVQRKLFRLYNFLCQSRRKEFAFGRITSWWTKARTVGFSR